MRSLITGVDGFIGSWLAEALVAAGDEVSGTARKEGPGQPGIARHRAEIADAARIAEIVRLVQPDRIFHLAALNNVMQSLASPARTFDVNVNGTVNVLEAARQDAPAARVVSVGSSAEYGRTASANAYLTEDMPLAPRSPYGVSKAAAGLLCPIYASAYGAWVVHVRPFAVIGPRKEPDALSDFCKSVLAVERGEADAVSVGDTSAERDFVDVRDAASALVLIAERGAPGEAYNLCNQTCATLADVLARLQAATPRPFVTKVDPARLRPVDDPRIVGNAAKIRALGYAPQYSLDETIRATLEHWRGAKTSR